MRSAAWVGARPGVRFRTTCRQRGILNGPAVGATARRDQRDVTCDGGRQARKLVLAGNGGEKPLISRAPAGLLAASEVKTSCCPRAGVDVARSRIAPY